MSIPNNQTSQITVSHNGFAWQVTIGSLIKSFWRRRHAIHYAELMAGKHDGLIVTQGFTPDDDDE